MNNINENISEKAPVIFYPYFLKKRYKQITGNNLHLFFPKLLSEKIQWLKLFDSTKEKGIWADKIEARNCFVKLINDGESYLKPILGVWDNFDDIDWDKLPDRFILKLNHGCGFNSFIMNKSVLLNSDKQFQSLKNRISLFKSTRHYLNSLELHYKYIKPRIFAEELIGDETVPMFNDWMIYCFNGEPKFCNYILHQNDRQKFSFIYNENYEKLDFSIAYSKTDNNLIKPYNFEKMFEFARILSENFKFVRVDFIEFHKKLYFAEMTFTPYSGYFRFNGINQTEKESLIIDRKLGDMLKL